MNVQQRIIDHIYQDAYKHLKYGTSIPKRDAKWDKTLELALVDAKARLYEEVEVLYKTAYSEKTQDMPYMEWLQIAKSLYIIDGLTLKSIARGPDFERSWEFTSFKDLMDHLNKLLHYKKYDHFSRQQVFMYVPGNLSKKAL